MKKLSIRQFFLLWTIFICATRLWASLDYQSVSEQDYFPVPYGESSLLYSSVINVYGLLLSTNEATIGDDLLLSEVNPTTTLLRPIWSSFSEDEQSDPLYTYYTMKTENEVHYWDFNDVNLAQVSDQLMTFPLNCYVSGFYFDDTLRTPRFDVATVSSSGTNRFSSLNIAYLYLEDLFSNDTSGYPLGLLDDSVSIPRSISFFNFPELFFYPSILDSQIYFNSGTKSSDFLTATIGKLVVTSVKVTSEKDDLNNSLPDDSLVIESDYAGFIGKIYTQLPLNPPVLDMVLPENLLKRGTRSFFVGGGEVWINGDIYYNRKITLGSDAYLKFASDLESVPTNIQSHLNRKSQSLFSKTIHSDGKLSLIQNYLICSEAKSLTVPHIKTASGGIRALDEVNTIDLSPYSDRDYIASYVSLHFMSAYPATPYTVPAGGYDVSYDYSDVFLNQILSIVDQTTYYSYYYGYINNLFVTHGEGGLYDFSSNMGILEVFRRGWQNILESVDILSPYPLSGVEAYHGHIDFSTQILCDKIQTPLLAVSTLRWSGWGGFIYYSDLSLKSSVIELETVLSRFMRLNCVEFEWKDSFEKTKEIGLIAQEVQEIFPELVSSRDDLLSIDVPGLLSVWVKAIQEAHEDLNTQIQACHEELDDLVLEYQRWVCMQKK